MSKHLHRNLRSFSTAVGRRALAFCWALALLVLSVRANDSKADPLLETGSPSVVRKVDATPAKIKIVSYNIRWRGGEDLKKLIELLRSDAEIGQAAILGLQEVDRNRKRTAHANTARLMAESLGMHYAWAAPPPPSKKKKSEEETGVALLSLFPLTDVTRIVLPHEGPGGRRRVALGATVKIGEKAIRVYSLHGETRIGVERKLEQYSAVLDDLNKNRAVDRAIVVGDFNSWEGSAAKGASKLFEGAGFTTPFSTDEKTFRWFMVKFKLDWVWFRGFEVERFGIDRKIELSDHWPLWAEVKM